MKFSLKTSKMRKRKKKIVRLFLKKLFGTPKFFYFLQCMCLWTCLYPCITYFMVCTKLKLKDMAEFLVIIILFVLIDSAAVAAKNDSFALFMLRSAGVALLVFSLIIFMLRTKLKQKKNIIGGIARDLQGLFCTCCSLCHLHDNLDPEVEIV